MPESPLPVEAGRALPSRSYTDPSVFVAEQTHVLRKSWHFGTHTSDLAEAGDVVTREVAGVPIVFTRADDGAIRAFVNICRHRAHPVVLESGHRDQHNLRCLYHGWTYGLDGGFVQAPRSDQEGVELDARSCALMPVQTYVWGPTVWVNPDVEAPTFETWAPGLAAAVAADGIDVESHVLAFEREFPVRANWKVFVDNAIECYHCPTCHPTLSAVLVMNPRLQTTTIRGPRWSTHRIPFRDEDLVYTFHWIFPTTYFQYGRTGFDVGTIDVRGVHDIIFRSLTFVHRDMPADDVASLEARLDDYPTIREDVAICERVQHSHESGVAATGQLLPGSEQLVVHFQRTLVDMMRP